MNLNLFEDREIEKNNTSFVEKFMKELKKALANFEIKSNDNQIQNKSINETNLYGKNQNNVQDNNILEEYNLFEKRKVFLDNKSRYGNDFAWVTDENSVCISEHGDGGSYFIKEIDLPYNAQIGEVYEKINGKYVYNDNVTKELKNIDK